MKKVSKFISLLLAALMLMTSFAFAADSKEEPAKQTGVEGKYTEYTTYKTGVATMTGVAKSSYKNTTKKVLATTKLGGKTYKITTIAKNAFAKMKKLKTVKFYSTKALTVKKGAFGKLNTKKITVKVTNKMSKKEFKKFAKNLKKAGFKGTIKRVKL